MIFSWWEMHKRDLPWRHTHDPYKILVSEVMLQQTQVSRVIAKYAEFIEAYPTIYALAQASPASVLRMWKGMGYNRRALYLHKTAQVIKNEYKGIFPKDEATLQKLPGLGTYTARAVLVFAFKQNVCMVDTNIRQIITHFFFSDIPQSEKIIQETADQLLPKGKSWEWHQALMDYGALELSKLKLPSQSRKSVPFKDSNRFYRGKVIDRLRDGYVREKKLIQELSRAYGKNHSFYTNILKDLLQEGLISRSSSGIISLPE